MAGRELAGDRRNRERWLAVVHSLNQDIDPQAIQLMDDMRQVAHTLYQIGETSLTESGLSYARYRLLMDLFINEALEGNEELNPSQISRSQGTSRNTISTLISELEDENLIERRLDRQDRRRFNIRLTDAGRSLVRGHASNHFRIIAGCFSVLNAEEQMALSSLLAKLSDGACASERQTRLHSHSEN